MYLLWNDEVLPQSPFLKLTIKVCWYPLFFVFWRRYQNPTMSSMLILEDAGKSQCISQVLKVRFVWILARALKQLTRVLKQLIRATGCMRAGNKRGWGFLMGSPLPSDHPCHQSSPSQSYRDWRPEFGDYRMFAAPREWKRKIWIKLYSVQRHVGHSNDFHYPCGHLGWWSSLRFSHKN